MAREIAVYEEVLSKKSVESRKQRCEKENLCFISLKHLGQEIGIVEHSVGGAISVLPKYVGTI